MTAGGKLQAQNKVNLMCRTSGLECPEVSGELERVMGIEPTQLAWKARVLPLYYTRTKHT